MTAHTLSLSRAHKIAERIKRELKAQRNIAVVDSYPVRHRSVIPYDVVAAKMAGKHASFMSAMKNTQALSAVMVQIRSAIAAKNAEIGLNALLAKQAVIRDQLGFLEGDFDSPDQNVTTVAQFVQISSQSNASAEPFDIVVSVLSESDKDDLKREVALLRREVDILGDHINDLNAKHQISVEIDDEIAAMIGL